MTRNIENKMNIETKRLKVRTFEESDYYDLCIYASNWHGQ